MKTAGDPCQFGVQEYAVENEKYVMRIYPKTVIDNREGRAWVCIGNYCYYWHDGTCAKEEFGDATRRVYK